MAQLKDLAAPSLQDLKIPSALQTPGMPSHLAAPQGEDLSKKPAETPAREDKPADTIVQEKAPQEAPETVQTETEVPVQQEDPWQPIKERFKDRLPTEVLDEYETLKREREDYRTKAEEREIAAKELQERLIAYDAKNDPEYRTHVLAPVEEAQQLLIGICLEDPDLYKQAFELQMDKAMEPKERAAKLNAFFTENSISKYDWDRGFRALKKTYEEAQSYDKNYSTIKAQKDQERLKSMEMEAKYNQDRLRLVHRTASLKADAELKKLGYTFLTGHEDVHNEHMLGLEKALSGAGYDQEQEVQNNIYGRLLLKNLPTIQAQLKELADLKAAQRSKPSDSPRETKKPVEGIGDTKSLESKIFGRI